MQLIGHLYSHSDSTALINLLFLISNFVLTIQIVKGQFQGGSGLPRHKRWSPCAIIQLILQENHQLPAALNYL